MKLLDKLNNTSLATITISMVVLYLSLNMVANLLLNKWRFDFTEESLHTISKGTISVLQKIEEPIHIKVYFSNKLGEMSVQYKDFYTRLKTFLENYRRLSDGQITLEFFTPEPYSKTEDDALLDGLQAVSVSGFSEQVYFGLVATNSIDQKELIGFFDLKREPFLEYDLSLLIHKLSQQEATKIGVISGWNGFAQSLIYQQLQSLSEVSLLPTGAKEIDPTISTLVVIKPATLSDRTLMAIEQFALKGGNVLLFVDPLVENDKNIRDSNPQSVTKLLKAWGVDYNPNEVASDLNYALTVSSNTAQGVKSFAHPTWLELSPPLFAKDSIIMAKLEKITLATSGFLKPVSVESTEGDKTSDGNRFIPLIQTSDQALPQPVFKLRFLSLDTIRELQSKGKERLTLSAHISTHGVKTIFTDGVLDEESNQTIKPQIIQAKEPLNAIIVADVDMLMDHLWARSNNFLGQAIVIPVADNGRLFNNAVENLSGNDAFINLRSRGQISREFTLLKAMQKEAEIAFAQKENALSQKLSQLQQKINAQRESIKDTALLNQEQQKVINEAQNEMVKVRQELRSVQHELRKDTQWIKNVFKWFNILAVPLVVVLFGWLFNRYMQRQRQKYFN